MTWQPIETAPSGNWKTAKQVGKDGKEKTIKTFVPEWCFVMLDGKRYNTHKLECGRWNGFTSEQTGDCWHPYPPPPHTLNEAKENDK